MAQTFMTGCDPQSTPGAYTVCWLPKRHFLLTASALRELVDHDPSRARLRRFIPKPPTSLRAP